MSGPTLQFIPDILEEHFEELQFLWGQRQTALRSPRYTMRELSALEERIEAHVQGLLVAGEQMIGLVEEGLSGDDPLLAFAAAYALLRLKSEAAGKRVIEAFAQAKEGQLDGIREALCLAQDAALLPQLRQMLSSSPPPIAVAAAEVMGFQRPPGIAREQWNKFLNHEDDAVRQAAWRAARLDIPQPEATYRVAFQDKSPDVQREALMAAAWGRQPWLLEHCRKIAGKSTPENIDGLLVLAILGKPQDLYLMLDAGKAAGLGPQRFRVLGAFGHPAVMEMVLKGIGDKDPLTAVAAGQAFTKITGADIESDKRVQVPPADGHEPDEFEKEFLDEVKLPDLDRARAHWSKVRDQFSKGSRWCRGLDLSNAGREILDRLDLESRWEACLRGKFEGSWLGSPSDLEQFPQQPRHASP
jgi:uncharacterized protein (TIGR02270 family)